MPTPGMGPESLQPSKFEEADKGNGGNSSSNEESDSAENKDLLTEDELFDLLDSEVFKGMTNVEDWKIFRDKVIESLKKIDDLDFFENYLEELTDSFVEEIDNSGLNENDRNEIKRLFKRLLGRFLSKNKDLKRVLQQKVDQVSILSKDEEEGEDVSEKIEGFKKRVENEFSRIENLCNFNQLSKGDLTKQEEQWLRDQFKNLDNLKEKIANFAIENTSLTDEFKALSDLAQDIESRKQKFLNEWIGEREEDEEEDEKAFIEKPKTELEKEIEERLEALDLEFVNSASQLELKGIERKKTSADDQKFIIDRCLSIVTPFYEDAKRRSHLLGGEQGKLSDAVTRLKVEVKDLEDDIKSLKGGSSKKEKIEKLNIKQKELQVANLKSKDLEDKIEPYIDYADKISERREEFLDEWLGEERLKDDLNHIWDVTLSTTFSHLAISENPELFDHIEKMKYLSSQIYEDSGLDFSQFISLMVNIRDLAFGFSGESKHICVNDPEGLFAKLAASKLPKSVVNEFKDLVIYRGENGGSFTARDVFNFIANDLILDPGQEGYLVRDEDKSKHDKIKEDLLDPDKHKEFSFLKEMTQFDEIFDFIVNDLFDPDAENSSHPQITQENFHWASRKNDLKNILYNKFSFLKDEPKFDAVFEEIFKKKSKGYNFGKKGDNEGVLKDIVLKRFPFLKNVPSFVFDSILNLIIVQGPRYDAFAPYYIYYQASPINGMNADWFKANPLMQILYSIGSSPPIPFGKSLIQIIRFPGKKQYVDKQGNLLPVVSLNPNNGLDKSDPSYAGGYSRIARFSDRGEYMADRDFGTNSVRKNAQQHAWRTLTNVRNALEELTSPQADLGGVTISPDFKFLPSIHEVYEGVWKDKQYIDKNGDVKFADVDLKKLSIQDYIEIMNRFRAFIDIVDAPIEMESRDDLRKVMKTAFSATSKFKAIIFEMGITKDEISEDHALYDFIMILRHMYILYFKKAFNKYVELPPARGISNVGTTSRMDFLMTMEQILENEAGTLPGIIKSYLLGQVIKKAISPRDRRDWQLSNAFNNTLGAIPWIRRAERRGNKFIRTFSQWTRPLTSGEKKDKE